MAPAQNDRLEKLTTYFLINISLLILFGMIMVFSSSYMYAKENFGTSHYFTLRQFVYLVIGLVAAWSVSRINVIKIYRLSYKIHAFFCFLLTLTLFPVIGVVIKGSHRWLNLGFTQIQPGEFVKFSLMLVALRFFENYKSYTPKERMMYFAYILYPLLVFLVQPDFGTFAISVLVVTFFAFLSSFPRKLFAFFVSAGFIGVIGIMFAAPYRVKRVLAFLDPWQDPRGAGFQIIQSFLAFANGSLTGQGLGNSNEKLFYLPEAYNDFIFSVVGEELGFIGVLITVVLYLSLILLGFRLCLLVRSRVGSLLIAGITFLIGFQAFLNMGVVLGLLPTKGLNLPFISYGGSSLVTNLMMMGLVMACLRIKTGDVQQKREESSAPRSPFKQAVRA